MLIAAGLLTGLALGADIGVSAPDSIETFFENYCYDCHDSLEEGAEQENAPGKK